MTSNDSMNVDTDEGCGNLGEDAKGDDPESEDNGEDNDGNEDNEGLPIDRGWAWAVLAGSFLNVVLMVGYGRAIGILFVEYLVLFEASATKTTLFMGVMAALYSLTSLISMNILLQVLGERKLVLLGGVISSVGMLTAVFATSITFLICTHSILIGIGHSMIHGPALVLIGKYFNKRRGLATAISMSGISVGGSVFPPLVRFFVDEYGVRGSMLLITGLTMNMLVGASLFRPLESFKKSKKRVQDGDMMMKRCDKDDKNDQSEEGEDTVHEKLIISENGDMAVENKISVSGDLFKKRGSTISGSSVTDAKYAHSLLYSSNPDITSMLNIKDGQSGLDSNTEGSQKKNCEDYLKMIVVILDFRLFKNPMFQFFLVASTFAVVIVLVSAYLPALASEKGVSPTEASLLLTIYGVVDLFSKLAVGYLADLKVVKSHHIASLGLFLAGTATQFTFFYNSYALLIVYSVLLGLFGGVFNSLLPVIVVDLMGVESMAKVLGFLAVFHGLSIALTHPLVGAIRDVTGSYNACMSYIGACVIVAAFGLLFEPLARKRVNMLKPKSITGKEGLTQAC